jgi:hypothetical protein
MSYRSDPDYYKLLGVDSEAGVRDIEAAYWRFARSLRGPEMASYNRACRTRRHATYCDGHARTGAGVQQAGVALELKLTPLKTTP